jgi:GNAT superfamily N-acetyltransferase
LTSRELVYLTDTDRFHHEAIAAVDPRDGSIVGVGRYVRYSDRPNVAEVALEVADDLQNMGIGTALATHIVQHARATGVALLTAGTLWDNGPARAMLRRFEFRARASQGSVIELDLELDSPSVAEWRRSASGSQFDAPDVNDGTRQTRTRGQRCPSAPHQKGSS